MGFLKDRFYGAGTSKTEQAIQRLIRNDYTMITDSEELVVLGRSYGRTGDESEAYVYRTGALAGQVEFYLEGIENNPRMSAEEFLDTQKSISRHQAQQRRERLSKMTQAERALDRTIEILREEGFTQSDRPMASYTFERKLDDGTQDVVNLYDKYALGTMLYIRNGEIDQSYTNIWDYNNAMRPGPVRRGFDKLRSMFSL